VRASVPFVLGLSLVLLARLAGAEDPPTAVPEVTRLPLEAKDIPSDRSTWYGLYMGGAKSGWLEDRFRREGAVFVVSQILHVEAKAMGQDVRIDVTERWEYDGAPPFALRGADRSMNQGGGVQTAKLVRREGGYVVTVEGGGTTRELPAPVGDLTLADHLTLERWFRGKPAAGSSVAVRSFDIDALQPDVMAVNVFAEQATVVDGVSTTYYEATLRSKVHGEMGTWRFGPDGLFVSLQIGGLFEARREPESVAKTLSAGGDLFVKGIATVKGRIAPDFEAVKGVTDLVLQASGDGVAGLKSGPRQEVSKDPATGATVLRLGAAYGTPDEASATEVTEALAETPAYPTKDARVVELAKTAVADATTPSDKVARLVAFVEEFLKDEVCAQVVPVVTLLDRREGDCSEHAALFATLARAAGVPAREVSGLMYMGDEIGGFGGHAWNEVALDGVWVPVDATHGETELDATHIALGREGRQMDFAVASGRLSFEVRSVKPPPGPPKPKEDPKPSGTPEPAPVPR
jgi:protein-glutamine gamma-glutamyltransferase